MTRTYAGILTEVASGLREMLPRMASQAAATSRVASGFKWPYTRYAVGYGNRTMSHPPAHQKKLTSGLSLCHPMIIRATV